MFGGCLTLLGESRSCQNSKERGSLGAEILFFFFFFVWLLLLAASYSSKETEDFGHFVVVPEYTLMKHQGGEGAVWCLR